MKTQAEQKFHEIIKTCFHEKLKPLKFKKKANNFYRDLGELGQIINIQKSMFRSKEEISFTVNIGIFSPLFWNAEYNHQNEQPPIYPTESVCAIRKRIGKFLQGKDTWYELNKTTNTEPIQTEILQTLEKKILPFLEKVNNNEKLIKYLENEYQNYNKNYLRFILYGELKQTNKLKKLYPTLIKECTKNQIKHIQEKANKYGIKSFV